MQRLLVTQHPTMGREFAAQVNFLSGELIRQLAPFTQAVRELMIAADKRKAIYLLHQQGMGVREIARHLDISPTTVKTIIDQKGQMPLTIRKDKLHVDPQLLGALYRDCKGHAQRIYEKLNEEHGIAIGYSTLTQLLREHGFGTQLSKRCHQVDDAPGEEMQHDTSPYQVRLGSTSVKVQASLIYLRYSKVRYLKFYRYFKRFTMKCFLHEALLFWGYAEKICIIDNTNLARLKGIGKNAVIVPEMASFAKPYGFRFVCHEKGHANRKAGNERGFYTVETNFFPGRHFENLQDLNRQAFQWTTQRSANRPTGRTNIIPAKVFEYEKQYLKKLPAYIEPPYQVHERGTDQYGYMVFKANYYWVPGTERPDVKVLEYSDHLMVYQRRKLLGRYRLAPDGVKNEKIEKARNIIFLGPTGIGKTGLATAFLMHAVEKSYSGRFITFPDLVERLYQSVADHTEAKIIKEMTGYDCLLIDELGYIEVDPMQVSLFFTLMHKRKTTMITSNLGFSKWGSFLKNNQLTAALIDRLTENSHVINMKNCVSLRTKLDLTV